ncbi:MAG: S41 family peptidase [Chloroflexi bacterium]|nr:S41 family peptidase [Chloroflexota bacterium]
MQRPIRTVLTLAGSVIALCLVFSIGFVAGATALGPGVPPPQVVAGDPPPEVKDETDGVDFGLFWEAWSVIQDNYYDGPLAAESLREGAIRGLAEATDDPYTRYHDPEQARRSSISLSGSYVGIGIRVEMRDDFPFVTQPLPRSPAEAAGIGSNEFVLAVDGVSTKGTPLAEFGRIVRGERGTSVTLTLRRQGETTERDVTIVRDRIVVQSVTTRVIDDVGYMRIANFSSRTSGELRRALSGFRTVGVERLVVDLRNNPGGLLDASVSVTSRFLPEGELILRRESRNDPTHVYNAVSGFRDLQTPMVVLVNSGSASGSEVFAGALQAHGRATLIGEQTHGKGSVQELHKLSDGSVMRVTTGIWFTPAGVALAGAGSGLTPDLEVAMSEGQIGGDDDPVLAAGLEAVRALPLDVSR